jgi:cation transport ATPase
MKQNLGFALLYNTLGVPLAAASCIRPSAYCSRRWSLRWR